MQPLSDSFIEQCKIEDGFRLRGENMTRIEVFVDAAFAFAVTMLVISIDQIPTSVPELIAVTKQIPAFIASVVLLMWIWQTHSSWSKRFGLDDTATVVMSVLLIILVLIFIYPLKIMAMGMFGWLTNQYLPSSFDLNSWNELRFMFSYFGIGFSAFFLLFLWMNKHALKHKESLKLSLFEQHDTQTYIYVRYWLVVIGLVAAAIPYALPDKWVPFSGFVFTLISLVYFFVERRQKNKWDTINKDNTSQ
ncbi:MAG: DUF1211 domain-containing protein [Gammaproteobacteria bacterium]|nr:DUF1211 domain-containing protein [Gammaproteobacteria bacterium]